MSEPAPSRPSHALAQRDLAAGEPLARERRRDAPALRASWLLRVTAIVAFLATVMGVLVAPGLRGLAKDRVVEPSNLLAWTLAYVMSGFLIAAIVTATFELTNRARVRGAARTMVVVASGIVMALAAPALIRPLPTVVAAGLAVTAGVAVLAGAWQGVRARHTRAVAIVMASFAVSALLRVAAWDVARIAGDHGNTDLYAVARVVATAALVLEGLGQMTAAAWLGTRSRLGGQLLSSVAIGLAWIMTWSAARGALVSATSWEAGVHIALATASGLPQPYGPSVLASFLLAASILLAGVAAVQPRQVVVVVSALSLSLIARGAFDVPLHALAAAAAALWVSVAVTDQRAMWRSLVASREADRPPGLVPPPARP